MFREDLDELIARTRSFHESSEPGSALVEIMSVGELKGPSTDLLKWKFPDDMKPYLEEEFKKNQAYWSGRKTLKDDRIPSITAWYGIAEHSAYVGGDVVFGKDTSYHKSFLSDWDDLDKLALDDNNQWRKMLDDGLGYLKEISGDSCAVSLRGSYSPMEVANSIRGNDLLMDFYLHPEETHALMDFSSRAVEWNINRQMEIVGPFHGGYITGFKSWIPGNSFGHFSEDTTTLTGPDIYRNFGLYYTRRALEKYDNIFIHTHALGEVSFPVICELENLYMMEISSDPNTDRAIDVARRNEELLDGKILILNLTAEEIKDNLDFLKRNRTIIWYEAETVEDAQSIIDYIRQELPVRQD